MVDITTTKKRKKIIKKPVKSESELKVEAAISTAEASIKELMELGANVDACNELLDKARDCLKSGMYEQAENYAREALETGMSIKRQYLLVKNSINSVEDMRDKLTATGIDVDKVNAKLAESYQYLADNEFLKAFESVHQARELLEQLSTPPPTPSVPSQQQRPPPSPPSSQQPSPPVKVELQQERAGGYAKMIEQELGFMLEHKPYATAETRVPEYIKEKHMEREPELTPGFSYLIKERRPTTSYKLLRAASKTIPALCITSTFPDKIRKLYNLEKSIDVHWLSTTTQYEGVLDPQRLDFELSELIFQFVKNNDKSIILLDGIELILSMNNFETVLSFIKSITDILAVNNAILIVSFAPGSLPQRESIILEKSFDIVHESTEDHG